MIVQCPNCGNKDKTMIEFVGQFKELMKYFCKVCGKNFGKKVEIEQTETE